MLCSDVNEGRERPTFVSIDVPVIAVILSNGIFLTFYHLRQSGESYLS